MFKKIILLLLVGVFFSQAVLASDDKTEKIFKARVVEVINEQENELADGSVAQQQKLRLEGIGSEEGKVVIFDGIGDFDVIKKNIYKKGDKVLVLESRDDEGNISYYITDYVRNTEVYWLFGLFFLVMIVIGRWKGVRSILSLVFSFIVITKYIIPQILSEASPVIVVLIGSFFILLFVIYLTEGFKPISHIAVVSIFISLVITVFISYVFIELARLSGLSSEETAYIINIGEYIINFKGLFLAGIIIGALGVLDDIVISQAATAQELIKTDKYLGRKELYKKTYEVGLSHISSMTNTLFLAYAGAALPLLVLVVSGGSAFSSFSDVINNEAIAEEIVRTLSGSIGLVLAVPISTFISVWWLKK